MGVRTDGEYSNKDAEDIIETEGLGCFSIYVGEMFKDPETMTLWNDAEFALMNLINYIRSER